MRKKRFTVGLVPLLILSLVLNGCSLFPRHTDIDVEAEGLIAVQTKKKIEKRTETRFYALAKVRRAMTIDSFQADEAVIYTVPWDCFESYIENGSIRNRVRRVALTDEQGQPCEVPDVMEDIFEKIAQTNHDMLEIRIFDVSGEYFIYAELNVNLHSPNVLLYYHPDADAFFDLFTFENEEVEQIQILSLERLHNLYSKNNP